MHPGTCFLLDSIQPVIRTYRIVVEEEQLFDLRCHSQLTGLLDKTMPPAICCRHVTLEILGIVNQHISIPTKLDKLTPTRRFFIRWVKFVICQIDERPPRMLDPVPPPSAYRGPEVTPIRNAALCSQLSVVL
jgi:hypothetical protein